MRPRKFYIFFPPALAKWKRGGIEYGIGDDPARRLREDPGDAQARCGRPGRPPRAGTEGSSVPGGDLRALGEGAQPRTARGRARGHDGASRRRRARRALRARAPCGRPRIDGDRGRAFRRRLLARAREQAHRRHRRGPGDKLRLRRPRARGRVHDRPVPCRSNTDCRGGRAGLAGRLGGSSAG